LSWFDRALAIRPDFVKALNNKVFSLANFIASRRLFAIYGRSKSVDPDNSVAD